MELKHGPTKIWQRAGTSGGKTAASPSSKRKSCPHAARGGVSKPQRGVAHLERLSGAVAPHVLKGRDAVDKAFRGVGTSGGKSTARRSKIA